MKIKFIKPLDHARKSINEHPFEWHDILRHDWSKGEEDNEED